MQATNTIEPGQATWTKEIWTSNPTPANSKFEANTPDAELTEMIRESRNARTLRNIARRAERLWDDGYTVKTSAEVWGEGHSFHQPGAYYVTSPALPGDVNGDTQNTYKVRCSPEAGDACTCPAFDKFGTCKHYQAVKALVDEGAEGDALELAESATTGVDPFARY